MGDENLGIQMAAKQMKFKIYDKKNIVLDDKRDLTYSHKSKSYVFTLIKFVEATLRPILQVSTMVHIRKRTCLLERDQD